MTVTQLALKLCILAMNMALAAPDEGRRACAAQPAQVQAAYVRQAAFILAP